MSDQFDPSQLLMVYMTLDTITERIEEDPPETAVDTDDEDLRKQLLESAKRGAYAYDTYRDIRQISFLSYTDQTAPRFSHYMFCDAIDVDTVDNESVFDNCSVAVFDTEDALVHAVSAFINNYYVTVRGVDIRRSMLAGWKVGIDILPILLNKMLKYDSCIPAALKTDITKKFATTQYLIDVSTIYTQGVSFGTRRLPSLADTLKYWGYSNNGAGYAAADKIRSYACTDPRRSAQLIEPYLRAMFDIILKYNDIGSPWRDA